ncbi:MAG: hypothetical protein DVB26_00605 [Verrucomicrobia bacterium]|nr:MAG: hypothetical protein DVB26_00605 [Verrucomicrobiota bacterium]
MIRSFFQALDDRWANLHSCMRLVLLSGVLAGLGWLVMKPCYQEFKAWRMQRNLAAARQAIAEQRMDDARDLSLTVLRAGDSQLEAYQILEKATAALRNPMHGDIARALMAHPQSTDEDRLNGFRGVAAEVALGLLGQAWTTLSAECRQDRRFALVFADRLITERRLSEAASVLLAVPETARDGTVQRRLIQVLIGSGNREGYDEAQRMIASQMPTNAADAELREWLTLLESIPVPSLQAKLLAPLRGLLEQPAATDAARLNLLLTRIDYAANFSQAAQLIDAAIGRWKERDPVALAGFLGDLGLYQRLLDTLPPESVQAHPELFHRLLQAMEHCAAWKSAIELLNKQGERIPKFEELAHRAIAIASSADATTRATAWADAMADAKASASPGAYLKIQRLASDAGMTGEAEQAMVAAIQLGRGPLPLYAELKPLLNSLARQGRDNTLLEICASYLSFEPGNPVLLTQFTYLACLNHVINPKTILKAVQALAGSFPKDLTIQCVMATAYLCDGQANEAAATFDRLELDPANLTPGFRAAYLTTQVLTERIAGDDPRITEFPWKSTQPCERKKFNELLRSTQHGRIDR